MKKIITAIGVLILSAAFVSAAFAEEKCDRKCLVALMDQYLAALAKHDG